MTPEWITAIGTFGLALVAFVAIFRDLIQGWLRHPEWQVAFERGLPDCNRIRLDFERSLHATRGTALRGSADAHWIRVRIKNVGKAGAEDVEVSATEVRHKGADGVFQRVPMSTPWNLSWKNMSNWVLPRLPVGSERHIDIGHVVDPQVRNLIPGEDREGSDPAATLFCLAFTAKSNTYEYLLNPGEYEIDFQVFAANSKPSSIFTFSLSHTGKWFLDEVQMYHEGLRMSVK